MSKFIKIKLFEPNLNMLGVCCPNCGYKNISFMNIEKGDRIEGFKCGGCKIDLQIQIQISPNNYADRPIEQLIEMRAEFREQKDWKNCDDIRDYLDTKHVFIFDTPDGQVVYNELGGTRQDVINKINQDKRAEAAFDAWLFSTKESWRIQNKK